MSANAGLGVLLQPREQHPCNRLALLNGAVIRVLAADVRHMERGSVVACNPVGHFVIRCEGRNVSVGFNDFVVAHGLPAKTFPPMFADGCDGGVLRCGRAMDDEVGDVSHGYSSGFRRGYRHS